MNPTLPMGMQSLRSQITLITPTYNRSQYITRLLDYYAQTGITVFVEDSSDTPLENEFVHSAHVKYSWQPHRSFIEKFYKLIQRVETPYIALCSDDDFIIPEALDTCIEWLNNHTDYSAADGQRMRLINKNGRNYFFPELRTDPYPGKHNASINPIERVQHQVLPHEGLICAVVRTAYMKEVIQYCRREPVNADTFSLVLDVNLAVTGKTVILPLLYSVLSYIPGSSGTQAEHIIEHDTSKMNAEQQFKFAKLVEYCSAVLNDKIHLPIEEGNVLFSEILAQQHQRVFHPLLKYGETSLLKRFAKVILPELIYLLLGESIKTQNLLRFLRSQEGTPYSDVEVRKRLERVSAFVEKHNAKTSIQVPESNLYLALRRLMIDRYFCVTPRL